MDGMTDTPPPGRTLDMLDAEELGIVVSAIHGLVVFLGTEEAKTRAGSPRYHQLGRLIGKCRTLAGQIERAAAKKPQAAEHLGGS